MIGRNKMDWNDQLAFIGEIKTQCKFFNMALENIRICLDNFSRENWDLLFYSLQNLLVSAALISKILWPIYDKYKNRGVELRKLLDIDNDSILKCRKVRDHFEHYDERIDQWKATGGRYEDLSIINSSNGNTDGQMRSFNPKLMVVSFKDNKYEINKVSVAIAELYNKIIDLDKREIS